MEKIYFNYIKLQPIIRCDRASVSKWECVYLRELETGSQARQALGDWFRFYNEQRPHTAFDGRHPMDVYWEGHSASKAA